MVRMIASWGSSGSGKTLLCLALASQLAAKHRNVVIISADSSTPVLPVFLPSKHIGQEGSLGGLLSSPIKNVSALKGYIHIHPESSHIGVMGCSSGETPIKYTSLDTFNRESALGLLAILHESPFDYVIFDCQQNAVFDALTQLALATAEYPIRCITPDVRGIEFEKAQKGWMRGTTPDLRIDEHIRIINPVRPNSPLDSVLSLSGAADYILPYSDEVYDKGVSGRLICGCRDKYGIIFEKRIRELTERIISDEQS